jgi:ribosome maturation factor RimP
MTTGLTNLENLLTPALKTLGLELITCKFVSEAGRRTLRVMIDSPNGGLTIEDSTRANRQIQAILNAESGIDTAYDLEVSSPGLDRPLITPAHFQQFAGAQIKIKLHNPLEDRRHFTGQLLSATEQCIQILVDEQTFDFDFDNIEKANLVPDLRF